MLTERLVIGGGVGKGIIDNKEPETRWNWKKLSDDWTVGVIASYVFWANGPHSLDITPTLEYRINEKKAAYSFDIGYGSSF